MFAMEEACQMTWPVVSRKLLASVGLGHDIAEISSSRLALSLAGALQDFTRSIVQVFSRNLFGENWGWII